MICKKVLIHDRIRRISGSFAWIGHKFIRQGFWHSLTQHELLLYFFLFLVADRNGISYYSYDKICTLLGLEVDEYILARDSLINKDLLAFDGTLFQVLSLPDKPVLTNKILRDKEDMMRRDPATVVRALHKSLGACHD